MASEHAFDLLFEDVVANLAADGNTANVVFGAREIAKRVNFGPGQANRVVFVPGDEKGALGEYGPAVQARLRSFQGISTPRTLRTLEEVFRVYCWAVDATDPENERKQYVAARYLHDQVVRAMHNSAHVGTVNFVLTKPQIVPSGPERKFGCEIMVTLIVTAKIPDDPGPIADLDFANVKPTTAIGPTELPEEGETDTTSGV
jgi:hypothetical protein